MMRRSPMPTKRKTPRRTGEPRPRIKPGRVVDLAHLKRVRSLPCICCLIDGIKQDTPTEAHHIRRRADGQCYGAGQKAHDTEAIPLCRVHHWNGSYCQGNGLTLQWFEHYYGNERDLLAQTLENLKTLEVS